MVRVTSEVGRLRRVLMHNPGAEVDRMVPGMMEELLFDDILFGYRAREEHGMLRRVFGTFGVDVVEASDLVGEALGVPGAREWLLDELAARGSLTDAARSHVEAMTPPELATELVHGIRAVDVAGAFAAEELFELVPVPNWCFQRDPLIVLHDGVMMSAMATRARRREALLWRTIFRFHPDFVDVPVILDPAAGDPATAAAYLRADADGADQGPCIEGGDLLVLSRDIVAVGHSERTNGAAIAALEAALRGREDGPRWLVVVEIPKRRAYMHLDTLFTPVDRDATLIFPPVLLESAAEAASVHAIDLRDVKAPVTSAPFLPTLSRLGLDLEPIPCGGPDPVQQQREQWTDGANAFAIAPGVITLYDRNVGTAEELERRGFRIVHAQDILLGREEVDLETAGRLCVLVPSHELSRARGGPHCLTHPLERDDL